MARVAGPIGALGSRKSFSLRLMRAEGDFDRWSI
jgi:hypothetical protein